MAYKYYDLLRTFSVVANHSSITKAADELCLTKGAVSYQVSKLEDTLGLRLFKRASRTLKLTSHGNELNTTCQDAFHAIDSKIAHLQRSLTSTLTIGVSTYFASRWLSPRLMMFMSAYPLIQLRIQPMLNLNEVRDDNLDVLIRWGDGRWQDVCVEKLFDCPAFPVASPSIAMHFLDDDDLQNIINFPLLKDSESSTAWKEWHRVANLDYIERQDNLIVPDPNVRVQTIMDGQGIALFDKLIEPELNEDKLARISSYELKDYGYFLTYKKDAQSNPNVGAFLTWVQEERQDSWSCS